MEIENELRGSRQICICELIWLLQKYHGDNTQRSILLLSFLHCRIFWAIHFKYSSINRAASVQASKRKYGSGYCGACVWCERKGTKFGVQTEVLMFQKMLIANFCINFLGFVSQLKWVCTRKAHTNTLSPFFPNN